MQYPIAGFSDYCYCNGVTTQEFRVRLRELREARGIGSYDLARRIGRSESYISLLETGLRGKHKMPPADVVQALARELGVSTTYLLTGDVTGTAPAPPPVRQIAERPVSYEPAQLQELGQMMVRAVEQQRRPTRARPATDTRRLPIVNAIAANEAMEHDLQAEDYVDVPNWMLNGARDPIVFRVVGECLRDLGIFGTDLLVVDRANREPRQGDVVAARVNGEETAKCFYRVGEVIELRPAAPGFPTITVNGKDQLEILGVYVTYLPVAKRV